MPGKFTDVAKRLQRVEPEDKDHQQKVDELKTKQVAAVDRKFRELVVVMLGHEEKSTTKIEELTEADLGYLYAKHKGIKAQIEALESANNMILTAIDQEMVERFDATNKDGVRLTGLGLFSRDDKLYIKIVDDGLFDAWAAERELDYRIRNTQKVQADARDMLVNGEDLPPGLEARWKVKIHFTKEKGGPSNGFD